MNRPVRVAQVVVNDAFAAFSGGEAAIGRLAAATLRISQPWVEGEAYEIQLVTGSGGTRRIHGSHNMPSAMGITPT